MGEDILHSIRRKREGEKKEGEKKEEREREGRNIKSVKEGGGDGDGVDGRAIKSVVKQHLER